MAESSTTISTSGFDATITHVEDLHAEATKLMMRHARLPRDIMSALELADQAMELAQVEQTIQQATPKKMATEATRKNAMAADALVDKCSRLQAMCYDLLEESYSHSEEYEYAAYQRRGCGHGRGIHGLIGEDDSKAKASSDSRSSGSHSSSSRSSEKRRAESSRMSREESHGAESPLWELDESDSEDDRSHRASRAAQRSNADYATIPSSAESSPSRKSIRFSDEVAPMLRRQKSQYFNQPE